MVVAAIGFLLVIAVLFDAFVTIILPKTVSRSARPTQLFYAVWGFLANGIARKLKGDRRESFLGMAWPMSTIVLIFLWAVGLMFAFAMVQFGLGTPMTGGGEGFGTMLYMSAATFLTLGYGDVTATTALGRTISMFEAGTGFGFLALVIGFMPVFYQSFSNRERTELLLDARAGAPPMAGELLRFQGNDLTGLRELFAEYERWAAGLLENFLSYPVLAYYRSQHAQLSWLACLTCVTDACAFVMATYREEDDAERALKRQAAVTFAIARHLAVDLAYIQAINPVENPPTRIDEDQFRRLYAELQAQGVELLSCEGACTTLRSYIDQYDPYYQGLADSLLLDIPNWMPSDSRLASWQTSAWEGTGHF